MACLAGLTANPNNASALKGAVFFVLYLLTTPSSSRTHVDTDLHNQYYFVYVLGFLGILFLYASEVAPVRLRGPASWMFNIMVA